MQTGKCDCKAYVLKQILLFLVTLMIFIFCRAFAIELVNHLTVLYLLCSFWFVFCTLFYMGCKSAERFVRKRKKAKVVTSSYTLYKCIWLFRFILLLFGLFTLYALSSHHMVGTCFCPFPQFPVRSYVEPGGGN